MEFTPLVRALRTRLSYWRRVWGCCSSLKAVAFRVVAPTQTRLQQPTRARSTEEAWFNGVALFVVWTPRGEEGERAHLISARKAENHEYKTWQSRYQKR